ncbi:condensation domain-containing protein [Streptomyces sp. NPDC005925]|uniref:condensation domain-containing protein n=1 Tax=Streptomyces sp. NPDC005925 TaxID=3157172 RepID=UPI0033C20498
MTGTGTANEEAASAVPSTLSGLLARLSVLDVRVRADGDTLHYDAPRDAVTDDLLDLMRRHKAELLRHLRAEPPGRQPESSGPTLPVQRRMYDKVVRHADPAVFNVAHRIDLAGLLDVTALQRALTALLRRQPALRTRLGAAGDELVQEVMSLPPFRLDITDLRGTGPHEPVPRVEQWLREHAATPFDLSAAPLLRAALARTGEQSWTLVLVVHHIVVDGWGLDVLLSDLGALYAAAQRVPGPRPPTDAEAGLVPLATSYADAARQVRRDLSGPRLERLRSYWRQALAGAPMVLDLPYDHPSPERPTGAGGRVDLRLDRALADGLGALAGSVGTTVFTVLLSAYGTLLCRLTGQREVVVACNIAGRTRREFEPLVGLFTGNVALRLGSVDTADAGVPGAVRAAAQTFFAAADHQEYPLDLVLADRAGQDPPDAPPFPQAVVVMESQGPPVLDVPGLTARISDVSVEGAVGDVCLILTPDADGIHMTLLYAVERIGPASAERWAGAYEALLREYAGHHPAGDAGLGQPGGTGGAG